MFLNLKIFFPNKSYSEVSLPNKSYSEVLKSVGESVVIDSVNPQLTGRKGRASFCDLNKYMKLPKKVNRYCPKCKKHTSQTLSVAKQKSRSSAHPLSRWGTSRVKSRGYRVGHGNLGRFSKPAVKARKRKSKTTRRIVVLYTCSVCKKAKGMSKSIRTGRLEIGEKVAK